MRLNDIPTPALIVYLDIVQRNIRRLADYAAEHRLAVRPHVKTHKSIRLAQMQLSAEAAGLAVAKPGEAALFASLCDDLLLAYPAADAARAKLVSILANHKTLRVALDSPYSAQLLSDAAQNAGTTIGSLIEIDVGLKRTGVVTSDQSLGLAQCVDSLPGLRLDGIMYYPGHIWNPPDQQTSALARIDGILEEHIDLWKQSGLSASILSAGSSNLVGQYHWMKHITEIRAGTYIFNDANAVRHQYATWDDCAARICATVISTSLPGQAVIDAGSKTIAPELSPGFPDGGYGLVLEFPEAKLARLSEEHGILDLSRCEILPKMGQRLTILPNHICPCVNLQDSFWATHDNQTAQPWPVDARGKST